MIAGTPRKYKILKIRSIWLSYKPSMLCISSTIRFYSFVMLQNERVKDLFGPPIMILNPKKKHELCEEIFTKPNFPFGTKLCGSLVLQIADFLRFVGTNFCDFGHSGFSLFLFFLIF